MNGTQLLNGQLGRVHHACVREQTNKMKCSLKVSGEDNQTGSQQTMIDEQYTIVQAEEQGERSISTKRNGSLMVRVEKLAGIKKHHFRWLTTSFVFPNWSQIYDFP